MNVLYFTFTALVLVTLAGCRSASTANPQPAVSPPAKTEPAASANTKDHDSTTAASPAAGDLVRIQVKGMSCPQCAYNINQQLYKLPGVTDVIVDLGEGVVTAKLSGQERPTKEQVDYAIRLAGFTPDRIEFK